MFRLVVFSALLSLTAVQALGQTSYELTDGGFAEVAVPEPGTPAAELAAARKLIAQDEPKKALKALEAWIEDYPNDPLAVEAYLLRGDAKAANGDFYKALFDYEEVITYYPASEQFWTAIEREYEIGVLFTTGFKRKLWGVRWLPADGEGAELLIRVQERAPGSPIGEQASIALADHYFNSSQMILATEAYDLFLINYPESELRQWALLRLIQASLARFKGPEFDGTGLIDAGERLRQYRDEYPAAAERVGVDALLVRIRESLARRDYASANWYDRTGENVSAALLYRRLIQEYSDTTAARDAVARLEAMGEPPVLPEDEGDE
ncbi:outer membrane protein assembly factor BamD [Algisphaera agarilytica]|uniref:Outer membrane protein assembly factor BamD (BamD/ComL family) n=1 Tax=Algisphaera agarilytica TaxID=1385975 RepID=A0A7X0H491_9BACT|nr:outer membrane protein assembly factor BamD [Algisphaera agarilytica]MBB6428803.1 outer membrane protein assembly factor BamD (BamD/ComL family) [Algisphaera agarilytica]